MSLAVAGRIARREMRGGVKGFRVFLACLALGVAAIAAIGTVRDSLQQSLVREGATLLGGDVEIELTYRFSNPDERSWMQESAQAVSEIVDFRSMVATNISGEPENALTQIKAVDGAYPLTGSVLIDPPMPLHQAFDGADGLPGAVMDRVLVSRLGLEIGSRIRLGTQEFVLSGVLEREPDSAGGFSLGPRTLVRLEDLENSGLLAPGTLFESAYRMRLAAGTNLDSMRAQAQEQIEGGAFRWRDRRRGAPGIARFVNQLSIFLILVSLAGLAVGGIGVSAAVRAYLEEKTGVIATLKSLGADGRTIFQVYFIQIGVLTVAGIALGLVIGGIVPWLLAPVIESQMPLPIAIELRLRPMAEAALYGFLAALLFTIWPLSRAENIRAAALFRDASLGLSGWPRPRYIAITGLVLVVLVSVSASLSGQPRLTVWAVGGLFAAFLTLVLASAGVRRVSQKLARSPRLRKSTTLRHALASVGGPGGDTTSVILSLGLGLAVLAAVGQIDANLRSAISRELPTRAPSFFMVDIQTDQIPGFSERLSSDAGVSRVETAPMLRGVVTQINGKPARETAGGHWVIRGDRGITFSAEKPENAQITEGSWWPADYSGEPLISFAAEEAEEMGLKIGDTMTLNILGRDITAEIANMRKVDFSNAGMGFVLSLNPGAVGGAPHTHIATVYSSIEAEAGILRDLAKNFPNITIISVRETIDRVSEVLRGIAAAITYGAMATLITGVVVLIGAAAAGERARTYEAAILKTLGASQSYILVNFSLRAAILGAAAGFVAIIAGGVAGWAVMTFVMEVEFSFEPISAVVIVASGVALTIVTGLGFSLRSLRASPAQILRSRE